MSVPSSVNRTVHFETLGCRLNQDESEGAARSFLNHGFTVHMESLTSASSELKDCVLCVVNTCTVTQKAEQKARRIIRLCLEKAPGSIVIVTGCYAESGKSEIEAIDSSRVVTIPGTKKHILALVAKQFADLPFDFSTLSSFISQSIADKNSELSQNHFTLYTSHFEKHSRATIKIQDGCNNCCAFCAIHFARGKSISLDVHTVLERVKQIEQAGSKEVVFTGVNLSQYNGFYSDQTYFNFSRLLEYLLENTSSILFRISSFYPQYVDEELCEVLKNERVQPFFHLSVQSGSDSVLRAMHRPYTRQQVLEAVTMLRRARPEMFISCDIIAGFPGESYSDFEDTKDLCMQADFSFVHAFPFSPRKGTEAFSMKGQLSSEVKNQRNAWLNQFAFENKCKYIKSFTGRTFTAITEMSRSLRMNSAVLAKDRYIVHCVTSNYIHGEFVSNVPLPQGSLICVRIVSVDEEKIKSGSETEALVELV